MLLYTMQILALLNTDVGLHVISTGYCIYSELTGQGLPLADLIGAVGPAEGSLRGKVPVCIQSRVSKRPDRSLSCDTCYMRASLPGSRRLLHKHL